MSPENQRISIPKRNRRPRLGDILLASGAVSDETLRTALEKQRGTGRRIGEILLECEAVSEAGLARNLAAQWGFRYVELSRETIDPCAVLAVQESLARRYRIIPVELRGRALTVAMEDAMNYEAIQSIGFSTGRRIVPIMADPVEILKAIDRYYTREGPVQALLQETGPGGAEAKWEAVFESAADPEDDGRSLEEKSNMAPIIGLADRIIARAAESRASDIHLEPGRAGLRIRYRIDGILREQLRFNNKILAPLVSRLKIMARLDIAERRLPQDGAIRFQCTGQDLDLRVSTLPTGYGEKVVIRLLNRAQEASGMDRLGLSEVDDRKLRRLLQRKQGILLLTGPTGSGKTTSLYAMIRELAESTKSVVTVEDPVEYELEGINQIQVKPAIGLTFASCLRSILRQDPNIILIGEIRDLETAEIAMRASMTGHFVLSTLHTNDAPSAITRLVDLGVPRYLVASGIIGVVAQRLVRSLCPRCKTEVRGSFRKRPLYRGTGCPSCDHQGCLGRVGLFEVMEVTPELAELVGRGASERLLRQSAHKGGMRSLVQDGKEKVRQGTISAEEVMRVVDCGPGEFSD